MEPSVFQIPKINNRVVIRLLALRGYGGGGSARRGGAEGERGAASRETGSLGSTGSGPLAVATSSGVAYSPYRGAGRGAPGSTGTSAAATKRSAVPRELDRRTATPSEARTSGPPPPS